MARRVVAIPLRGSIPCNTRPEKTRSPPQGRRNPLTGLNPLQPEAPEVNGPLPGLGSRNPLTGLNPLQPLEKALEKVSPTLVSQSPYGAQSLATGPPKEPRPGRRRQRGGL